MGGADGRRSVANAGGHADNRLSDNGIGENAANAALIAAAPEMLLALKLSAKQFRFYEQQHLEKNPPDDIKAGTNRYAAEVCESVIARAEGQ